MSAAMYRLPASGALDASVGRVEIDHVAALFKVRGAPDFRAVDRVALTLEPGSFTTLIGPSGCGKSTLLNMVAGFVLPDEGQVRIDGRPISAPHPDMGVVFQQYALFPWLTARGNIEFALKRFGMPRAQRRELAHASLASVGLADKATVLPGQLSGGMKQRLALARTLACRPKVLLMDEPFGALDAQTRLSMHEVLLDIWQAHRTTVLFITHDVDEALVLSDRIHVMSAAPGRIIETIDIATPRTRAIDTTYVAARTRMLQLLRH